MSTTDPPSRAETVVGAGTVGCSVAYHLTELGDEDVKRIG